MTLEPVPVHRSDPAADPILLRNIGSYSHHSESIPLLPNALFLFRPWLPMQGREDTVVYNVDYSLQEPYLILWGISWSSTPVALTVVPLFAPLTLNLMDVMQSKCTPSQAFPACCSLQSLSKLHLHLLSRLSSRYILCSSQDIPLVLVFLLSIDPHSRFQRQCRWR